MELRITIASLIILAQTLTAQPLNIEAFVRANSEYDELNPVISPDRKKLYITIANHPGNVGGKKDPGDIWYSELLDNNQWSDPVHAGPLINDRAYNGIAGFAADGNEMFLLNHYESTGGIARTQGLAFSRKQGNNWSKPENIRFPYFQNKADVLSGYLSPDKTVFVFSAESYGTYGVEDIYICRKTSEGKWSEPRNLGAKINTQFQELSPSLSLDGNTLFFSSNGRKGSGSFDIYAATRLDDTWMSWSDPENMGVTVNTEGRDLYYREYPLLGFSIYTSTKNSDGYGDIKVHVPAKPFPLDSMYVQANNTPVVQGNYQMRENVSDNAYNHNVVIHGTVVNTKTGQPVEARVTFERSESTTTNNTITQTALATPGQGYTVALASAAQFRIKIESPGYISTIENLDVNTFEMKDLEMNFRLQPIAVGTTVNLKNVLFEQSKTDLLPGSYSELDLVVSFLKTNPSVKIELAGHTDNRGNPFQNVKLSQARADRVKDYLVSKGIESKRLTGKGYGGSKPIASNNEDDTRQLNRRVEFTIRQN